jgi:hypothetical protein
VTGGKEQVPQFGDEHGLDQRGDARERLPLLGNRFELHRNVVPLAPALVVRGVGGEGRGGANRLAIGRSEAGTQVGLQRRSENVQVVIAGGIGHASQGDETDAGAGVRLTPSWVNIEKSRRRH